ncbi:hypothetical protein OC498_15660, partial [Acinetobacter bohemicus]
HDWVLRSKKLATKWMAVKKPQNNEDFSEDELISLYEKALKKGFEAKQCVEISALPKRVQHQVLEALSILIEHGKLRKNFIHFQY